MLIKNEILNLYAVDSHFYHVSLDFISFSVIIRRFYLL
jgi:hypothetical protein